MPPVIPKPGTILLFETQDDFYQWLAQEHNKRDEIWVRMYKKSTGIPSINWIQAIDAALCWGWIDGLRKSFDAESFIQRFTPRRAKSIWSKINTDNVARLISSGHMQAPGLREIEKAKADGRWDNAYSAWKDTRVPDDLMQAIRANAKAMATFETLSKQNQVALAFRLGNLKREDTRARRVQEFTAMLARGERFYAQPEPKREGRATANTPAADVAKRTAKGATKSAVKPVARKVAKTVAKKVGTTAKTPGKTARKTSTTTATKTATKTATLKTAAGKRAKKAGKKAGR